MTYLNDLNPPQREAVLHTAGPILVVAGAGAGKTKTIAYRILHLILQGIQPSSILAITFTNKAAKEMRERILSLLRHHLPPGELMAGEEPFISTFHALGAYLLRRHGSKIGLTQRFLILDQEDSLSQIKEIMKDLGIDPERFPPKKIQYVVSQEKNRLLTPTIYKELVETNRPFPQLVARVWAEYETRLKKQNSADFDDLISRTVGLLAAEPSILADCRARFRYLLIDEYQDTNEAQYRLAKLLTGEDQQVCAVGDADQAIYGWRGADFTNLLRFQTDYPTARLVLLTENYRSTKTILAAANQIIEKNLVRHPKELFTGNPVGDKISILTGLNENEEAGLVADNCEQLIAGGLPPAEIAVLYRTNFQSRVLEEAMLKRGLPYQVVGTKFFERKEIKDALAFIKLALNRDDVGSLKRIINVPPRGIGKSSLAKIAVGDVANLSKNIQIKWRDFQQILAKIATEAEILTVGRLIKQTIVLTGLEANLKAGSDDDRDRLANLYELMSVAQKYDALAGLDGVWQFLTDTTLMGGDERGADAPPGGVQLMTIHAAKGLEFSRVFVTGLEAGLFPHQSFDDTGDEEEERRLFYVALTRAKQKLFLTYAQTRMLFGNRQVNVPSEFLLEISPDLVETKPRLIDYPTIKF